MSVDTAVCESTLVTPCCAKALRTVCGKGRPAVKGGTDGRMNVQDTYGGQYCGIPWK